MRGYSDTELRKCESRRKRKGLWRESAKGAKREASGKKKKTGTWGLSGKSLPVVRPEGAPEGSRGVRTPGAAMSTGPAPEGRWKSARDLPNGPPADAHCSFPFRPFAPFALSLQDRFAFSRPKGSLWDISQFPVDIDSGDRSLDRRKGDWISS